jgi:cytochrome c peroxidase
MPPIRTARVRWWLGSGRLAVCGVATAVTGLVLIVGTLGTAAAQTAPPPTVRPLGSLKAVPVPEPPNLTDFVQNKAAALQLGKALFWDMQVGSDGIQACASCHFLAGADNRLTNQVSPGLNAGDTHFQLGGVDPPNRTLTAADFPFHRVDPVTGAQLSDVNDVTSSQGVFRRNFVDVRVANRPGTDTSVDVCNPADELDGFTVGGTKVRRVEPRNAPTVINAIFNFRNFWDGRANNSFNGANPFGPRDPNKHIYKSINGVPTLVPIDIPLGSAASQAVGPPGSPFEMSCAGRAFPKIGHKLLSPTVTPLAKQIVDPNDSVLGPIANSRGIPAGTVPPAAGIPPGLRVSYQALIQQAFLPVWWNSPTRVTIDGVQFSQMEANFSLFFGLSVQLYEATLVANDTPFDRFANGSGTLSTEQLAGLDVFLGPGKCAACHGGAELTNASVANVTNERLERMLMGNDGIAVYDNGFYNTAVRPTAEDLGVGGTDPFKTARFPNGAPLSETAYCQAFVDRGEPCPILNQNANGQVQNTRIAALIVARPGESIAAGPLLPQCPPGATTSTATCDRINVDGAHKTPGLRNVELTGPYMHNGGMSTLRQVVDFYDRGGDFARTNQDNLDPNIVPLGLTEAQKNQLVAFMLALTDERVRFEQAPFDHPQLFVPNGHPGSQASVTSDPNNPGQARDDLLEIRALGAGGGAAVQSFTQALGLSHFQP